MSSSDPGRPGCRWPAESRSAAAAAAAGLAAAAPLLPASGTASARPCLTASMLRRISSTRLIRRHKQLQAPSCTRCTAMADIMPTAMA